MKNNIFPDFDKKKHTLNLPIRTCPSCHQSVIVDKYGCAKCKNCGALFINTIFIKKMEIRENRNLHDKLLRH